MKKCVYSILILSFLSICIDSPAQRKIKFGKVSMEEMEMKVYDKDSTAAAVILSDIGILQSSTLSFTRHLRIKILKKSGLGWGNNIFNTPSKGNFKVLVYNLEEGEIVEEKVKSSSIFEEEIFDNLSVYKVFAPGVKVGSIIDIEYTHFSTPYEWRFQERIPVLYSYLRIEQSQNLTYKKLQFGFEKVNIVAVDAWEAIDMPAFKMEPYLNDYSNYITKFELQVESIHFPGFVRELSTTWDKVIRNLMDFTNFGGVSKSSAYLNEYAKEVRDRDIPVRQKIQLAYDYIQENIKWDGVKTLYASNGIRENFNKNHSGNSAEINLLLISLLNKVGIPANPVVLSTRDNGLLVQHSPSLTKLNYVVAHVDLDSSALLLDATSKFLPPGILPSYCLNGKGLLVVEDREVWIDLYEDHNNLKKQFVSIKINDDLSAEATIIQQSKGYLFAAWVEKRERTNADDEIIMDNLQQQFSQIDITNYEITKEDKENLSIGEKIQVDLSDQVIDIGDGFVFSPILLFDYNENPFKSESRRFPVDLIYPKINSIILIVEIPQGYKVKNLPQSVNLINSDKTASFTYLVQEVGNQVQFKIDLEIKKSLFLETEYPELKAFFSDMIKKINEPLEIGKNI